MRRRRVVDPSCSWVAQGGTPLRETQRGAINRRGVPSVGTPFSRLHEDLVKPTIYLALTDDWELRGDGSGDIEKIQFQPMRELVRLYNKYGVRGTFNAEMMQQLAFRKHQDAHPDLKTLADRWDAHVIDAFKQGHDIQLHIHTRWSDALYEDGSWHVNGDWSILNYEPDAARAMLSSGKEYLENLLHTVDSNYKCLAFRAGALAIAPSAHVLNLLADLGIELDTSIVGDLRVETRSLQFDYTNCEESFLPFYPRMDDARHVSGKSEKIMCVPIHHFQASRLQVFKQVISLDWSKAMKYLKAVPAKKNTSAADGDTQDEWKEVRHSSKLALVYDKAIKPCLKGKHMTSDLSRLNNSFMREMLQDIRRRALATGLPAVPVVLTNHSKYIEDYAPIERFLSEASAADDIKFITLTELAGKLQAGDFYINTATTPK